MEIVEKILSLPPWIMVDGTQYEFHLWNEGAKEIRFCYTIWAPDAYCEAVDTGKAPHCFLHIADNDAELIRQMDSLRDKLIAAGHQIAVAESEQFRKDRNLPV